MTRHAGTLPPSYFDDLYAGDPDPWQFETSDYERGKYAATLAALPQARYVSALEVGCSIGVLTRQLAERCDVLVSLDLAERALARARDRCRDLAHVDLRLAQVPNDWPEGTFELILLSEVVYYLDAEDVGRLVTRVRGSLAEGGDVVLVHWTGETHYPLTGDAAAELFIAGSSNFLRVDHQSQAEKYRIDVLHRTP